MSFDHIAPDGSQGIGPVIENGQCLQGLVDFFPSQRFRFGDSQQGRVGAFIACCIRSHRLSKAMGVALYVENIIGDLKRQTDIYGIHIQRFDLRCTGACRNRAGANRSPNQRSGFHLLQRLKVG